MNQPLEVIYRKLSPELRLLAGRQKDGFPLGISRCKTCNEWSGVCLNPDPQLWLKGKIPLQCRCMGSQCRDCG